MSAHKYLAAARKTAQDVPNWGDLSIDQQAWELAKVCFNGQNPTLSAIALRAQTIKEAILSGELTVEEVSPETVPYYPTPEEEGLALEHLREMRRESELEYEIRTRTNGQGRS